MGGEKPPREKVLQLGVTVSTLLGKINALFSNCTILGDQDEFVKFMVEHDVLFETIEYLSLSQRLAPSFTLEVEKDSELYWKFLVVTIVTGSQQECEQLKDWWVERSTKTENFIELRLFTRQEDGSDEPIPLFDLHEIDSVFCYGRSSTVSRGRNCVISYIKRSPFLVSRLIQVEKEASQHFEGYLASELEIHVDPSDGSIGFWTDVRIPFKENYDIKKEMDELDKFWWRVDHLTESYFSINRDSISRDCTAKTYFAVTGPRESEYSPGSPYQIKEINSTEMTELQSAVSLWDRGLNPSRQSIYRLDNQRFSSVFDAEQAILSEGFTRATEIQSTDSLTLDKDGAHAWWITNKEWLLNLHLNRFVVYCLGISIGIVDCYAEAITLGKQRTGSYEFCIIEVSQTGTIRCHERDLLNKAA